MKNLIYAILSLFVSCATFAQADTTRYEYPLDEHVETVVDAIAEFPGGRAEMFKFISTNIKYPEVAKKNKLSGKSVVKFTIDIDGSISDVKIIRPMETCPECDAEAIRVVKTMPNWTPAKKAGKTVKSYYVLPFQFVMD